MKPKGRAIWNQGQQPERYSRPRLPPYTRPRQIENEELREAWFNLIVGEMLVVLEPCHTNASGYTANSYPHPVLYSGAASPWTDDINVLEGTMMVYLGMTNVDCMGNNGRVISKPYATVFYNGGKYLIENQNLFKPLSF